jgi:outer membrane receptor protein involved in Fe transport
MRTYLLLFLWIIYLTNSLYAQSGSGISGIILDRESGEPLTGATIQSGSRATISNYDGTFRLELVPGLHVLQISYVGYEGQTLTAEVGGQGFTALEIRLSASVMILETATITTGRYERSLGETAVSLEILRPRFIEQINAVSIDEALNRLPGVNIIDGQANIRGGSGFSYGAGSRVMLLVDDIPALQADAGFPNWNDIPVENLEQVEVMKGAGSALYGSAALNGIINVRTAFAKSVPYTKISTFYTAWLPPSEKERQWWSNSPSSTGVSLTHRQKFGKLDLSGSLFYVNTNGYIRDAYDEQGRMTLGLRYRLTDRLALGVNTNLNLGRSQDFFLWANDREGAYQGGGNNNNSISNKFRYYLDPYLNYFDRAGNKHKLLGRIYGIDNDNNLDQSNKSQLYYGEYQYQRHITHLNLVMTAGALGTYSRVDAELYGDTLFHARNAAAYLQLEQKPWPWLTLSAGARYEYNAFLTPDSILGQAIPQGGNEESKPIFRAGANVRFNPFSYLRASWGQGYRFPTIAEKYINTVFGGFQVVPNLQLRSETGWNTEIGWKQGLKMGSWNGYLDLALFWTEYQDMMEFTMVVLPRFQSQNIGDTRIRGAELTWQGQGTLFGRPMTMMAGLMYLEPQYKDFGEQQRNTSSSGRNILKYRFRHSAKMDLEMPLTSRFTLGYSYQYYSPMEAIDAIFNIIPGVFDFRAANNKGFHVMDLRGGFQISSRLEAWIILKNALNQAYSLRPALLEEPRNITVRLMMSLGKEPAK